MARPPGSGAQRYEVRLERRAGGTDGYGGAAGAWAELATKPAELLTEAGEEVRQAAQEAGTQAIKLRLRRDPDTETVSAKDRLRFDFFAPVGPASPLWNIISALPFRANWIDIEAMRAEKPVAP